MKKSNTAVILVSFLIGISLTACGAQDQNPSNISKNINNDSGSQENKGESWIEDAPDHVHHTIMDNADLAVNFDSYDEVIASSELVVTGTVQKIKSYMRDTRIISNFRFQVETASEGNVKPGDIITVFTIGGKVKFAEYAEHEKEFLVANSSKEEFEKEIALHGDEYIESIYEGVPNIEEGDELALCLGRSDENEGADYYIVGTSCFGQFIYDKENEVVYKKQVEMHGSDKRKLMKKMEIDERQFQAKVKDVLG